MPRYVVKALFRLSLLLAGVACTSNAYADALVVTKAMKASTIAEIYIESNQIRAEIEIGAADFLTFRNVLPDKLYQAVSDDSAPWNSRLNEFADSGWGFTADGVALDGKVASISPSKRTVRDEVTGDPIAVQPEQQELVLRLQLIYRFEGKPSTLKIRPPKGDGETTANIGFVCYHEGLPVNDFRYLTNEFTLDLDWTDPWYSRFRHRNLWRQFEAPLSVYLYVEPYEVRKEIIIRPLDAQHWVDLNLDKDGTITVDQQEMVKEKIAEFLAKRNLVTVDGKEIAGRLDRIHFIHRSLKSTGIIEPPVDLNAVSATLGVIFSYPVEKLPQQVSMKCDLFTPKIQSIPSVASDEAGGLPGKVTPEDPVLVWKNYLINPSSTDLLSVEAPPDTATVTIPVLSVLCIVIACLMAWKLWRRKRSGYQTTRRSIVLIPTVLVLAAILLPFARWTFPSPWDEQIALDDQKAAEILSGVLHNVYRSFDHHDESVIYDRLSTSISGDLLSEVYLETQKSMQIKNQGGLRISVKAVDVEAIESLEPDRGESTYRCHWKVSGWIGHWGHIHARENEHMAEITMVVDSDRWKIAKLKMLDEQLAESAAAPTESSGAGRG